MRLIECTLTLDAGGWGWGGPTLPLDGFASQLRATVLQNAIEVSHHSLLHDSCLPRDRVDPDSAGKPRTVWRPSPRSGIRSLACCR